LIDWIPEEDWAGPGQRAAVRALWSSEPLSVVVEALARSELQPLLVGGVVRDLLLGRDSKDVDLIINCRPSRLMQSGARLARLTGATPVALDKGRGILRLCFAPGVEIDLVALQGENLYADLLRRDLRINAMAIDCEARLADPFDGRSDVCKGLLQEVRGENFQEDPLRVLRAARFAAQFGFTLHPQALSSACRAAPGLERVAGERIAVELTVFFAHATPDHIELLKQLGVAEALLALPAYDWALLKALSRTDPVGLAPGLAVLFGPSLEPPLRQPLFERLKLSREASRYLERWWDGAAVVAEMQSATLEEIFELSRIAGPAFQRLSQALIYPELSSPLSPEQRQSIAREASGQGSLRWDPVPWTGTEVMESLQKERGPWLGETLRELEKRWVLGQVNDLKEGLGTLGFR